MFFIKKVRLSIAKLKRMHMIIFDQKLQEALAMQRAAQRHQTQGGIPWAASEKDKDGLEKDKGKIKELIVQLRSKMQTSFKLNLYLYFVLDGYNEYTMQQDQVLLNKHGIKIEIPSTSMKGPQATDE